MLLIRVVFCQQTINLRKDGLALGTDLMDVHIDLPAEVKNAVIIDWDLFLYSVMDLYVCVIAIDKVYEIDRRSAAVIYARRPEAMAKQLQSKLPCRVVLNDSGASLTCYCRKRLINQVQKIAQSLEPDAVCATVDLTYTFGRIDQPDLFQ